MLPQPMSSPFDKLSQRRVQFLWIGGVLRKCMLVADRFWLFVKVKVGSVQTLSLPMERFSPLAEQLVERRAAQPRQFSHGRHSQVGSLFSVTLRYPVVCRL